MYPMSKSVKVLKSLPCLLQAPTPHQPSFVDQNAAFQDLSESFRSLYKSVFENSQGEYFAIFAQILL